MEAHDFSFSPYDPVQLFPELETPAQAISRELKTARSGSFVDNISLPIHRWFRYSAGFSAQWAAEDIKSRYPNGAHVLDPFAGSGTTLLAADSLGYQSVGFESHPFVARIGAAKIAWDIDITLFKARARDLIENARKQKPLNFLDAPKLLQTCYTPEALAALDAIRQAYAEMATGDHVDQLLWLAITSILRKCSFVGTAQWQYVLPNKTKAKTIEPYLALEITIESMVSDVLFARDEGYAKGSRIIRTDARAPVYGGNRFDYVLTSPPYPNNYDYADATRLEMTFWREIKNWAGLQDSVRQFIVRSCSQHSAAERLQLPELLEDAVVAPIRDELAAACNELAAVRLEKAGRKTYHTMAAAYFIDLAKVFLALRPLCNDGAHVCFVIGNSAPYGVMLPAERWLADLAVSAGFHSPDFEKLRDRNTKWKNRKHTVPLLEGRLRFTA